MPKLDRPDAKQSAFPAVLSFVLGASALSISLFLWLVKARVALSAQPMLERTALASGALGLVLVAAGLVLRRRSAGPR